MTGKQFPDFPAFPLSLKAIMYCLFCHRNIIYDNIFAIRLHVYYAFAYIPSESQDLSGLLLGP